MGGTASGFGFSTSCLAGRSLARGRAFARQHFTKKHDMRGFYSKGDGENEVSRLFSRETLTLNATEKKPNNLTLHDGDGSLVN